LILFVKFSLKIFSRKSLKLCPGRGLNENAIEEINKGVVSDEKQASFHKNHLFREKNQYN